MNAVPQLLFDALSLGGIYAMAALGIALIFGVMKLVNFAHGEYIAFCDFADPAAAADRRCNRRRLRVLCLQAHAQCHACGDDDFIFCLGVRDPEYTAVGLREGNQIGDANRVVEADVQKRFVAVAALVFPLCRVLRNLFASSSMRDWMSAIRRSRVEINSARSTDSFVMPSNSLT